MGWLWLIIAIITFAVSMYLIGRYYFNAPDANAMMWAAGIVSLVWPLVLSAAVIIGPFFGLFYLGAYRAEKAKENKNTKK